MKPQTMFCHHLWYPQYFVPGDQQDAGRAETRALLRIMAWAWVRMIILIDKLIPLLILAFANTAEHETSVNQM